MTKTIMGRGALALFVTLSALTTDVPPALSRPIPAQIATVVAEMQVKLYLRDPDSAKFSDVHGADLPTVPGTEIKGWSVICGMVNARNGFGGYAGPERFVVIVMSATDAEVHLENSTRRRDFGRLWKFCDF